MLDRFETFATTVALMNRCVQRIKSREMLPLNLKGTHVMCLYSLGKSDDGLTAAELSKACGEDKAAISRTVAELAASDYVCLPPETDKRAYRAKIVLTDKGREARAYINDRVEHVLEFMEQALSPEQREDFYDCMRLIADRLVQYDDNASD